MKKIMAVLFALFGFYTGAAEPSYLDNGQQAKKALDFMLAHRGKLQRNPSLDGSNGISDDFVEGDYEGEHLVCGTINNSKISEINYYCKVKDDEVDGLLSKAISDHFQNEIAKSNGSYHWQVRHVRSSGGQKFFQAIAYFAADTSSITAHVTNGKIIFDYIVTEKPL